MASWNPVDSDEELEQEEFKRSTGKTALVVIISTTPDMFQPLDWEIEYENENKEITPFKIAIKCCETLWRNKVFSNDKDLVSILLCGTEQHKNSSDFSHLYMMQDMSTVKVSMIEDLQAIKSSDDLNGFHENIGSSPQYDLKHTFWLTKSIFEDAKTDSYMKKVLFFTNEDSPHASKLNLQQDAIEKFKDLGRVDFTIVRFKEDFQFDKFYSRIMEDSSSVIYAKDSVNLMKLINRKQCVRRPVVRSTLEISPGYKIGVGIYSFIRKSLPPKAVDVNKMTNEILEKVVTKSRKDTGMPVLKSEERKVVTVKGIDAVFEEDELKQLSYAYESGLKLIGFMNQSDMDFMNYYRSASHFLYPDEERITGSREFFTSLLKRCHAMEKIALVKIVRSRGMKPKIGCLIPSLGNEDEKSSNKKTSKVKSPIIPFPQGFHLFYLPYSDEIRKAEVPNNPDAPETLVEVMDKVVAKLTNRKFDISVYQNPAIQFKRRHLEKLAVETLEQEDFYDYSNPDFNLIHKRLGNLPNEVQVELTQSTHPAFTAAFSSVAADKKAAPVNMQIEYKHKRVDKLTVAVLKEFLESKGCKVRNARKDDLVGMVYKYFDEQD